MKKFYLFIFVTLLVVSMAAAFWQQDFSKVEIQATKIAGSVYMLAGHDDLKAFSGGNIGVSVGEDGVFMVDAKYVQLSDKIKAVLKKLGGESPKYIVNTHVHGDHVNGNAAFTPEATVVAHTNIKKRMADKPKDIWPTITFDQSLSFHMNGEEIKVLHYPEGHTDGDAIIYFTGSNVIHLGDHWFAGLFPFVDLNSGGTVQGYIANIKKVLEEVNSDAKLIPGHGTFTSVSDLKKDLRMLEETTALVTKKMKDGKSLDQIKEEGLSDEWATYSWNFITAARWIETIYNSHSN
jgi:glyoxylase-like metal-dependent hydrolase (beta-lactamase superfamily II)